MRKIGRPALFIAFLSLVTFISGPGNHPLIIWGAPPAVKIPFLQGRFDYGLPAKNANVFIDDLAVSLTSDVEIGNLNVGTKKAATVNHTAGINSLSALCLGGTDGSEGTYNLDKDALLAAGTERIGRKGAGVFNQAGGVNTANMVSLGAVDKPSVYNFLGGFFAAGGLGPARGLDDETVSHAVFNQKGGSASVNGIRLVAGKGTWAYNLEGGDLAEAQLFISCDDPGKAIFDQKGGINRAVNIKISSSGKNASYNLEGGELNAARISVGPANSDKDRSKRGEFTQTGGICSVGALSLSGEGRYNLRGGILEVGTIRIEDKGSLDIAVGKVASLKFLGDWHHAIDNYIKQGRIFDSTLKGKGTLRAVFDPFSNWTTIVVAGSKEEADVLSYIDPKSLLRMTESAPIYVYIAAVVKARGKALESSRRVEKDTSKLPGFGVPSAKRLEDFLEKLNDFILPDKAAGDPPFYTRSCLLGKTGAQSFEQGSERCYYMNLIAGVGPKSDARYDTKGHPLNVRNSIVLGVYGKGKALLEECRAGNSLICGMYAGSSGQCDTSGQGEHLDADVDNSIYIGFGGAGEYLEGGCFVKNMLVLGFLPGSTGKAKFPGEPHIGNSFIVGYGGKGETALGGIDNHNGCPVYLGFYPDSEGTVVQQTGDAANATVFIGYGGKGEYTQEHGIFSTDGNPPDLYLGYLAGSSGKYNFADGSLGMATGHLDVEPRIYPSDSRFNSRIFIGCAGNGILNQTGARAHCQAWQVYLGLLPGSSGIYNLDDGSLDVGESIFVGNLGKGEFNQAGGGIKVFGDLRIGAASDAGAVYNLKKGGLAVVGTLRLGGGGGKDEFNQTGGKVTLVSGGGGLVILMNGKYTMGAGELILSKLIIENGGALAVDPDKAVFHTYGHKELLNKYIAEGKIYNSSSAAKDDLVVVEEPPHVDGSRYITLVTKKEAAARAAGKGSSRP